MDQNPNMILQLTDKIEEETMEVQYETLRFMEAEYVHYYYNLLDKKIKLERGIDDKGLTKFLWDFNDYLEITGSTCFIPTPFKEN